MGALNLRGGSGVLAGHCENGTGTLRIWMRPHDRRTGEDCELTDDELGPPDLTLNFDDQAGLDAMIEALTLLRPGVGPAQARRVQ